MFDLDNYAVVHSTRASLRKPPLILWMMNLTIQSRMLASHVSRSMETLKNINIGDLLYRSLMNYYV